MGSVIAKYIKTCLLLLLLNPLVLRGQTDSVSTVERSLPVLNKHYFTPNTNFPSPFITTFFQTGIGGGVTLNTIPIYTNDGNTVAGTLEGENSFVTADIKVQVEAKQWLAVWFRYLANARIGSSTPTVFAHGVTSLTGFEFGWMLRLFHSDKSQLTGTLSIKNSTVNAINVSGFIKDYINNPDSIDTPISKEKNPLEGGAGIRYAYAFNDLIAIQAFLNGSYGESVVKDDRNVWKFNIGILGSVNFIDRYDVPVGVNLGYGVRKLALFESNKEEDIRLLMLKIAYTGREEYNIGLEFSHINSVSPLIKGENEMEFLTTSIALVYFF